MMNTSGYFPTSSDPLLPPKDSEARAAEARNAENNGPSWSILFFEAPNSSKLKAMAVWTLAVLWALVVWRSGAANPPPKDYLTGIPTLPYRPVDQEGFRLTSVQSIVVDSRYEKAVDTQGSTLIPPTLHEFAVTFASDLNATLGVLVNVAIGTSSQVPNNGIFLTLGEPKNYRDAARRPTSEGYSLSVNSTGITVTGASPLGTWWGTRTVLQQAILSPTRVVPPGAGLDSPGWATRGMMLDVGRHFYPKDFLIELCSYMSFFKQNTFHLHLSDNLHNNVGYTRNQSLALYARFRLYTEARAVQGLNKHRNESYTRDEFDDIQRSCAARGVTVLPEIEAPGHALVISQWKPHIGQEYDLTLLNISHPETIPAVMEIWTTFLPWFHCKVVSIGADEYGGQVEDYNHFVRELADHIAYVSKKSTRIWGTFPPSSAYKENIYTNVSIQHWAYFEGDPFLDYIVKNYTVVNSMDDFYVVNKYSGSYPQTVRLSKVFRWNSKGDFWRPHLFHQTYKNPEVDNPSVLGSIVPLWNDFGPNATVYSEAYYAWRRAIPALADKQWGGNLTERDFDGAFELLHPFVPAQNLDRAIPSQGKTIFNYTITPADSRQEVSRVLKDTSPNGYNASTDCLTSAAGALKIASNCSLVTPLSSKGRDYTLVLNLKVGELLTPTNATLITGRDSALMLTPALSYLASGVYFRLSSNMTLTTDVWTEVTISGTGNRTFATLAPENGTSITEEFITIMDIAGNYMETGQMAIEAPLSRIGGAGSGWTGEVRAWSLTS